MLAVLRQPRAVLAAGLAMLCLLAWFYILTGAGSGMSAWQMTTATLFPHRIATTPMPGMATPLARWDLAGVGSPSRCGGP